MSRARRFALMVAAAICTGLVVATASPSSDDVRPEPLPTDKVEEVEVRIMILDAVVLDRDGNPVSDLGIDDFELIVDGRFVPVATLDVACPTRDAATAGAARPGGAPLPAAPAKIVLAFDYLHLDRLQRVDALEQVKGLIEHEAHGSLDTMLIALTGGVRIEQPFTDDDERILAALDRMQHDPSLCVPEFRHENEFVFIDGLVAMIDFLGREPGPKAVVLYSAMEDVPLDTQFRRVAAVASASRVSIYPVDVRGLATMELSDVRIEDLKREMRERLDDMPEGGKYHQDLQDWLQANAARAPG
jgi:VWFA-related protein